MPRVYHGFFILQILFTFFAELAKCSRMVKLKTQDCKYCDGSGQQLDHERVGDYLRTKRINSGITQARVAEAMKISKPYLCDLEHGFRNWSNDLIARYRKAI
jgi:AraC-like DNA-binding protein